MRIRHVVTYLGSQSEFGGPTRVALDLARTQARRGHLVEVVAGGERRDRSTPSKGVTLSTFPVSWPLRKRLRFASMYSNQMRAYINETASDFDLHHVHLARDLMTLPVALRLRKSGVNYIAQTHGMIDASSNPLAKVLDTAATRRALKGARHVIALTSSEADELRRLGVRSSTLSIRPNGVAVQAPQKHNRSVVLFLARLHPRKGAVEFTRSAIDLHEKYPHLRFVIAGADEGDGDEVGRLLQEAGCPSRIDVLGGLSHSDALSLMSESALYVLPARREPFGLTIVEALSVGTPVLIHESAELSASVIGANVGFIFSDGLLTTRMDEILSRPEPLKAAAERAPAYVAERFSIDRVADLFMDVYLGGTASRE